MIQVHSLFSYFVFTFASIYQFYLLLSFLHTYLRKWWRDLFENRNRLSKFQLLLQLRYPESVVLLVWIHSTSRHSVLYLVLNNFVHSSLQKRGCLSVITATNKRDNLPPLDLAFVRSTGFSLFCSTVHSFIVPHKVLWDWILRPWQNVCYISSVFMLAVIQRWPSYLLQGSGSHEILTLYHLQLSELDLFWVSVCCAI